MIGLDANVLIRYLTQDDPVQSARANQVIDGLSESSPGYVTMIVLAEIHWVLRRGYKQDPEAVTDVLLGLLDCTEIVVERADTVRQALRQAADGADFADALIQQIGQEAGCDRTVTFDHDAGERAGMRLLA
ncbi:type II toxin-antitoxin system VapC family toxin [Nocardia sp. NBC_00881]|uniref:PIN domain-containing protein n=1 Tax=Nocardia sp. NBC_00881 TaxID=2975995 RepID=UPI0038632B43|nr:type II toxin-antitoxin system VapC family toxin [Nocardia sp. NBC_00881]